MNVLNEMNALQVVEDEQEKLSKGTLSSDADGAEQINLVISQIFAVETKFLEQVSDLKH